MALHVLQKVRKAPMRRNRKRWIIAAALIALAFSVSLYIAGSVAAKRFDPYIRAQAIQYLQNRFQSDIELTDLKVRLPGMSPFRALLSRGKGSIARADAKGLVIRRPGAKDPVFAIKHLSFEVDLGTLWTDSKHVKSVTLDGMEIRVPPRTHASGKRSAPIKSPVVIDRVTIRNATLIILPKDRAKVPLEFEIHRLVLDDAGRESPMRYAAELKNAKPPGAITSEGTFGPWDAEDPGDTPLSGMYRFDKANLG